MRLSPRRIPTDPPEREPLLTRPTILKGNGIVGAPSLEYAVICTNLNDGAVQRVNMPRARMLESAVLILPGLDTPWNSPAVDLPPGLP